MSYQRPTDRVILPPGTAVAERYVLGEVLGQGGSAIVYDAYDLDTRQEVAVKVLDSEHHRSATERERMFREARLASGISHESIVRVSDAGPLPDGSAYLVMERLAGRTLASRILECFWMPIEEAVAVAAQLLEALQVAHDHGVVHRDVNPSNIHLAEAQGEAPRIKLIDFGISRALADPMSRVTEDNVVVGTVGYMAPEQLFGDEPTERSDIYAAGATIYEVLTGRPAHDIGDGEIRAILQSMTRSPAPIRALRPAVPAALAEGVMRALEKSPRDRPASCREMMSLCELDAVQAA